MVDGIQAVRLNCSMDGWVEVCGFKRVRQRVRLTNADDVDLCPMSQD